jgi:streptogramin lyase
MVSTSEAYSMPQGIVVGPDGNIWFTAYNSNQVGRVDL